MKLPEHVVIKEVGPRDGLQNERMTVPLEDKIAWINQLSDTGLRYIEATSFVSPKWIPQLADAAEVMNGIHRREGVTYSALVPNLRGLERALAAGVEEVAVFMSASETHNRSNINKSIAETFPILQEVTRTALQAGVKVRGYVSTVFGCPYEKSVSLRSVMRITDRLLELGVYEVSLGDTIGIANPLQVEHMLEQLLPRFPQQLALHFHDTRGMALANILLSVQMGVTVFDASLGGLGGCPYAPGAAGNVATEDLVHMLHAMGIVTDIDLNRLLAASGFIQHKVNTDLPSHMLRVSHEKMDPHTGHQEERDQ
ncbi:hydroxymethylglutaryl-CoA lyase [Paenibacillus sp. VMFN-D1]|uniref:hydroxymethylglutaryl-CoA lyase n=1 Tax=Paenibacillus sp. VMFN-D1 TaxID=2135608 RepID=UPI000E24E7CA|nr:hydroxymethylglutaryl-CoA lyase [Paenibacillus sp. VMFN-D1]RED41835.1 hydroxymethylglutaryl-CoA lyase [Paenibacillus sp. VMFN-D1]